MTDLLIIVTHITALKASEYDRRAIVLMSENVTIRADLFASLVSVHALKLDFAEEVASDPIDLVKLAVVSTKWALIWVFHKQFDLALCTD